MPADHSALADRLVSYADAIVAVSFLGASGLGIAVADPDARASVSQAWREVAIGNLVMPLIVSAIILMLRRWELELRADLDTAPKALKIGRRLHVARLLIVWASGIQVAVLMWVIR